MNKNKIKGRLDRGSEKVKSVTEHRQDWQINAVFFVPFHSNKQSFSIYTRQDLLDINDYFTVEII